MKTISTPKLLPQSMHSFAARFCPVGIRSHDLPQKCYYALHPCYTEASAAPCMDSELCSMLKGASPMRRMQVYPRVMNGLSAVSGSM